ncbi:intraflagellar transport-associated protein isoform X2 [Echinops telfairi]|uniref:Intraflagellar transport-associated protein isoform X2 n=1 Tax=Echinops telfairi TaxID=9371 RepID=A0AC55D5E4_ECHTE|nr:intraflagellar transport-associated protein isoform X2 [Echinops telfairi]
MGEDNGTQKGAVGTDSSENAFTSIELTPIMEQSALHLRNKAVSLHPSSQSPEEEQILLDEGQKAGSSCQGELNRPGKVKVDSFLDLEDLDMDEDTQPQMSRDLLLLPGEVEQDLGPRAPSYIPSTNQLVTPEVQPRPTACRAGTPMEELLGDEVQPFSLDEEFDYDSVTLTPKFTAAEMDTIKERSQQKSENTSPDLEQPAD